MNPCGKLLGITPEQIVSNLKTTLETIKHNERLLAFAPDPRQAEIIRTLIQDNKINVEHFTKLYYQMTCEPLVVPPIGQPGFTSYLEGIRQAILQRVEQFDKLLVLYYSTTSETIQKIILYQASTILVHSRYLDYLFIKNSHRQSMS
jgi:hypothetical protein